MKRLHARIRSDSGQAFVFVALTLMALVGMAALVIDGGSWYRADRHAQTAADAAALAGAQKLPDRGNAEALADEYWSKNPDDSTSDDTLNFPDPTEPNYQITVKVTRKANGVFAKALGIDSVTVRAEAQAQVTAPLELKNVAPIAVHKDLACIVLDPDCFGQPVTLNLVEDYEFDPTKSKFGLLDLDRDGNIGAGDMKDWLDEDGYPDYLPVNADYPPANGEKNGIKKELQDAADADRVLLLPVYDTASASTGYHIIGWAAFVIDDIGKWAGKEHVLTGHFVTFIATDLAGGGTISDPDLDFGVQVITLTH